VRGACILIADNAKTCNGPNRHHLPLDLHSPAARGQTTIRCARTYRTRTVLRYGHCSWRFVQNIQSSARLLHRVETGYAAMALSLRPHTPRPNLNTSILIMSSYSSPHIVAGRDFHCLSINTYLALGVRRAFTCLLEIRIPKADPSKCRPMI